MMTLVAALPLSWWTSIIEQSIGDLRGHGRVKVDASRRHGRDRRQEFRWRTLLQDITGCSRPKQVLEISVVVVSRQGDDRDSWLHAFQRPGRDQTIHARHRDVHDNGVRLERFGLREHVLPVGRLADDLHTGLAVNQELQSLADGCVIVRDENAEEPCHITRFFAAGATAGARTMTVVPRPGVDSIWS
jgi:hypothetical protein